MGMSGGKTLFTRQSSGLVREVSVVNALFFNTAAFIGGTLGGAFGIAVLAGVPIVLLGSVTNWTVTAAVTGILCILLAIIFASLTSVMPRSGGDYVFTSRIVPRIGPLMGWLESWTLVFASIALLQFETVLTLRGIQMEGRIIGIGTGSEFFNNANSWFTEGSTGDITGIPGMIAGLVVLAVVGPGRLPADKALPQDRHLPDDLRAPRRRAHVRGRPCRPRCEFIRGQPSDVRQWGDRGPAGRLPPHKLG